MGEDEDLQVVKRHDADQWGVRVNINNNHEYKSAHEKNFNLAAVDGWNGGWINDRKGRQHDQKTKLFSIQ